MVVKGKGEATGREGDDRSKIRAGQGKTGGLLAQNAAEVLGLVDLLLDRGHLFHPGQALFEISPGLFDVAQSSFKGADGLAQASADFRQLLATEDEKSDQGDND